MQPSRAVVEDGAVELRGQARPGAAADAPARLEHHDGDAVLAQPFRRGEAGHPGADDEDAVVAQRRPGHSRRTSWNCHAPRMGTPQAMSLARRRRETLSAMS